MKQTDLKGQVDVKERLRKKLGSFSKTQMSQKSIHHCSAGCLRLVQLLQQRENQYDGEN